jgi:hypothetical protein
VIGDTPARFMHLAEIGNRVRRRPIQSKEGKGMREVELTESSIQRRRWLHIRRGHVVSGGQGWTKGILENDDGWGRSGVRSCVGRRDGDGGCLVISYSRGRERAKGERGLV